MCQGHVSILSTTFPSNAPARPFVLFPWSLVERRQQIEVLDPSEDPGPPSERASGRSPLQSRTFSKGSLCRLWFPVIRRPFSPPG